jgi:Spy/CpxP family protein refolding chaperone
MKLHTLLPLALLGVGFAQGPTGPARPADFGRPSGPPPQRGIEAIQQYLGLTGDQIQQIENARATGRDSERGLAEQIRAKDAELGALLESGTADAGVVGKLALELDTLRGQMKRLADTARQNVLGILSSEQTAKLQTLEEAAKLRPAIEGASGLGLLSQPPPPPGPPPAGRPR